MVITQRDCKLAGEFKNSSVWKFCSEWLIPDSMPWGKTLLLYLQCSCRMQIHIHKGNDIMYIFSVFYSFWMFPVTILSQKLINVAQRHVSSIENSAVKRKTWQQQLSLAWIGMKYWWGRSFYYLEMLQWWSECFSLHHICTTLKY